MEFNRFQTILKNPLNFFIAPFNLEAGVVYRFTLTGWMGSLPFSSTSVFNRAFADLEVLQSDLDAVISTRALDARG